MERVGTIIKITNRIVVWCHFYHVCTFYYSIFLNELMYDSNKVRDNVVFCISVKFNTDKTLFDMYFI